jgi:hypothetical protein
VNGSAQNEATILNEDMNRNRNERMLNRHHLICTTKN